MYCTTSIYFGDLSLNYWMVNGTGSGVEPGFLEKPGFFPQTLGLGVETRFYLPTLEILKVWKVKVYILYIIYILYIYIYCI